jgi:ribosomal-protein-alanine N-acetyltransferase
MQVSRDGLILHLSEHFGDACPGSTVYVSATGLAELHQELTRKNYGYLRPGLGDSGWGSKCMEVNDPFGNRLRFDEKAE